LAHSYGHGKENDILVDLVIVLKQGEAASGVEPGGLATQKGQVLDVTKAFEAKYIGIAEPE
jgi:hypothetical protein